MKKSKQITVAFWGFVVPLFVVTELMCLLPLAVMQSGCDTLTGVYNAGTVTASEHVTTKIIVDAEKLAQIGLDTLNTFIHLEKDHRAAYGNITPKAFEFSKYLRTRVVDPTEINLPPDPPIHLIPRGEAFLKELRKATKEFKANRTAANEANLLTAYKTFKGVFDDCQKFTTQLTQGTH